MRLFPHQRGGPGALPRGWGGGGDFLQDLANSFRLSSSGGFLYLLKYDPILFDQYSEDSVPGSHASPRLCSHWKDPTSWLPQTLPWPPRRPFVDHLLMTTLKSPLHHCTLPFFKLHCKHNPGLLFNRFASISSLSTPFLTLAICEFRAPSFNNFKKTLPCQWFGTG